MCHFQNVIDTLNSIGLDLTISFHSYETIDGTATSESDYIHKKDVMVFKPGETLKYIDITIIDDNEWEENEVFFVMLSPFDIKDTSVSIGKQSISEVTIINDDGKKFPIN